MSEDIKVTDGTVLESLNNKVDLDGGNYKGSGLEAYIHEHCGGGGSGFNLFDIKISDHILTGEEAKGWALQGTYVTKDAYPDFYNKCLEEYTDESNTKNVIKNSITTVGSLTNNNCVLSGFSASNYVTLPNTFAPSGNWEYVICFKTGNDVTTTQTIACNTVSYWGYGVGLVNGRFRIGLSSTATDFDITHDTNSSISANTKYYVKTIFNGSNYTCSYSTDNKQWTQIFSVNSTAKIKGGVARLGVGDGNNYPFGGFIYLEESYINLDGQRWWTGADVIDVNVNGHKFYPISKKSAIDEMYNSNGIADFYGIDEENERVFLPRNKFFHQLTDDVSKVNEMIEAGLPNISGWVSFNGIDPGTHMGDAGGVFSKFNWAAYGGNHGNTSSGGITFEFNASRSSSIYGKSTTVQPPSSLKLLYYCVGNTQVTQAITNVVEITESENDSNPLGSSFYFNNIQPNAGWLKSSGQWNDGKVYTTFYNWLVDEKTTNTLRADIKDVSEEYTDYDYVLNQDEMTFRLPLLNGSEDLPSDKYEFLELGESNKTYTATVNGLFQVYGNGVGAAYLYAMNDTTQGQDMATGTNGTSLVATVQAKRGDICRVGYYNTTLTEIRFIYAQGNGSLYFKVANAVQNLELLNASKVLEAVNDTLEAVNDIVPDNSRLIASYGMPSNKYIDLTLGASGTTYTASANGYFMFGKRCSANNQYLGTYGDSLYSRHEVWGQNGNYCSTGIIPVKKGQAVKVTYSAGGGDGFARFIYAEGEV